VTASQYYRTHLFIETRSRSADLIRRTAPLKHSIPGIALACVSLIVYADTFPCQKERRQSVEQRSYEGGCSAD